MLAGNIIGLLTDEDQVTSKKFMIGSPYSLTSGSNIRAFPGRHPSRSA
jgi:hypothetical protein